MADQSERERWLVYETPHNDVADYEVRTSSDYIVAEVHNRQHADLIAAAGDLYKALRKAVEYNSQAHEPDEPWWVREARAALRKAEGREGGDDG